MTNGLPKLHHRCKSSMEFERHASLCYNTPLLLRPYLKNDIIFNKQWRLVNNESTIPLPNFPARRWAADET